MLLIFKIVNQDVTAEEVDAIIDSDQQNQIFAQSVMYTLKKKVCLYIYSNRFITLQLMQNSRSGQAKAVLSEVQTRHDDIKRIQKTILVIKVVN